MGHILVLDVGTTNIKAFVYSAAGELLAGVRKPIASVSPQKDYVEQNPIDYLTISRAAIREAIQASGISVYSLKTMGITTQRETVVAWDKRTGAPLYPAIVWRDSRTRNFCERLKKEHNNFVRERTGLPIDPYFSASKMAWLIQNNSRVRTALKNGRLTIGTADSWMLWNLARPAAGQAGHIYKTDFTNASRTLLWNTRTGSWDSELLRLFNLPHGFLAEAVPSQANFGRLDISVLGKSIPITAVCGDQQASLYAAGQIKPVSKPVTKVTFGTGVFILQYSGANWQLHQDFFNTMAADAKTEHLTYALEAKISECASRVDPVLSVGGDLTPILKELSQEAASYLKKLSQLSETIIIDGGVTRDSRLKIFLEADTGRRILVQPAHEGTALGAAFLTQGARE